MKEKDANFTGADIRNGMTAVVSIKHPDPRFEGQTKTKLDNQDAATCVLEGDRLSELVLYFDRNLETLKTYLVLRREGGQDPQNRGAGQDQSSHQAEILL